MSPEPAAKHFPNSESRMSRSFGSVTDLVTVFSDCLRALSLHVSKVGIDWEDGKSYDDWDVIAQALYTAVVTNTLAYVVEGKGFQKLTRYGMTMPTYVGRSFLYSDQFGETKPFLKLQGASLPFDTAVFIDLDSFGCPNGELFRIPILECQFQALLFSPERELRLSDVVTEEQ